MKRFLVALAFLTLVVPGSAVCGGHPPSPNGGQKPEGAPKGGQKPEGAPKGGQKPEVTPNGGQKPEVNPDAQLIADFKARVEKYVELRKKADDSTPKLKETKDPKKIRAAQDGLAERIGAARVGVKRGEIFTPEISAHFRKLLRPEAKDPGTKDLIKDDNPGAIPFKVNGPYPDKEPLSTVPPNVLATLPQLPEDIEYRFVNKHLILRDMRANLIIDFMPNAIA